MSTIDRYLMKLAGRFALWCFRKELKAREIPGRSDFRSPLDPCARQHQLREHLAEADGVLFNALGRAQPESEWRH